MTAPVASRATSVTFPFDLVRHQAKILPPLSNITGLQIVTMFADVTLYGATISGSDVRRRGRPGDLRRLRRRDDDAVKRGVRRRAMRVSLGKCGLLRPFLCVRRPLAC